MLLTLHSYMLRDLLKTFTLSLVTLTGIFIFAGGLYSSIKFEGIGASDLFNVLPFFLPFAITYTMPISALFAATMAYGRVAADNELLACRAAGINIHWLFAPAILLGVVVTCVTLFSINVLNPAATRKMVAYTKQNIRDFTFQKLRQSGYVEVNKGGSHYVLTAQAVRDVRDGALIDKGFPPPSDSVRYMWVDAPVFLWIDPDERLHRYAVADGGLCQFTRADDDVLLTLFVRNARDVEAGRTATLIRSQKIGPVPLPLPFRLKPSMVGLGTLLAWREQPWLAPTLQAQFEGLRSAFRVYKVYREMEDRLLADQAIELQDKDGNRFTLQADRVDVMVTKKSAGLRLYDLEIQRSIPDQSRPARILAPRGMLRVGPDPEGLLVATLSCSGSDGATVVEYNPRAADYNKPLPKDNYATPELLLSADLVSGITVPDLKTMMNSPEAHENEALEERRVAAQRELTRLRRKVMGEFHNRLAFASSSLVTVLMAAILGVAFRGSRALVAFGLACIPLALAMVIIVIGKQQIEEFDSSVFGATIIWVGLSVLAVVDAVIMHTGVRR